MKIPFKTIKIYEAQHPLDQQTKLDQTLASTVDKDECLIRFSKSNGVILGKLDTVLANFDQGISFLKANNYDVFIRKSGGLAVVTDENTLNISMHFSTAQPEISELYASYDFFCSWLKSWLLFLNKDIQVKQIDHSYCPGKYDCSIDHKKFCGVAQFRTNQTIVITAHLMVAGNQEHRGNLIKEFYDIANTASNPLFPTVDPSTMATLSQLSGKNVQVNELISIIKQDLMRTNIPIITLERMDLKL